MFLSVASPLSHTIGHGYDISHSTTSIISVTALRVNAKSVTLQVDELRYAQLGIVWTHSSLGGANPGPKGA